MDEGAQFLMEVPKKILAMFFFSWPIHDVPEKIIQAKSVALNTLDRKRVEPKKALKRLLLLS